MDKYNTKFSRFQTYESKVEFQQEVLRLFAKKLPSIKFSAGNDPSFISFDSGDSRLVSIASGQISIGNIKQRFLKTAQTNFDLKTIVDEFVNVFTAEAAVEIEDWETVEPLFRPVLKNKMDVTEQMVSLPFYKDVGICLVRDGDESLRFITPEDLLRWNKSAEYVLEIAKQNLARTEPAIVISRENPTICFFENLDSFDAVRIALPEIQGYLHLELGTEFCFGVPNRDFLVCWELAATSHQHRHLLHQIEKSFRSEPYKISRFGYILTKGGKIRRFNESDL